MNLKKYMKYLTIGVLALSLIGCNAATASNPASEDENTSAVTIKNNDDVKDDSSSEDYEETPDGFYVSPTDDIPIGGVITLGEIIEFHDEYVHIMSGDLIEVFKYDGNQSEFYLRQEVELIKEKESNVLRAYQREDYITSTTNMGGVIENVTGKIIERTDEYIVIKTENGKKKISTYEPIGIKVNEIATVYFMDFGQGPSEIMTLNEESKLLLKIDNIRRGEDGAMLLALKDDQSGEYTMNASSIMAELDLGSLAVGDILTVYHEGIMESWPMQLDTVLIRK